MGRTGLVGSLSVPQGWLNAAPAIRPVAVMLPQTGPGAVSAVLAAEGQEGVFNNAALSGLAGRAIVGNDGTVARSAGGVGDAFAGKATSATIIVIPADE
jgi:hypothetical protein